MPTARSTRRFDLLIWRRTSGSPKRKQRFTRKPRGPFLGVHNGTAYYLLYNGILRDKRPDGGNVLTSRSLADLPPHRGPKVIYGEATRLGAARLKTLGIVFKQTPYDVKAS